MSQLTSTGGTAGQGMTEYILIVAIVSVLSIAALTAFGDQVRALFAYATESIGGNQNAQLEQIDTAGTIKKQLGD